MSTVPQTKAVMNKDTQSLPVSTLPKVVGLNEGDRSNLFMWMIDGFSFLKNRTEVTRYSGNFKACGFTWRLQYDPNDTSDGFGSRSLSLRLFLVDNDTSSNSVVQASYKLVIYDQLKGKHVENEGVQYFHESPRYSLYCKVEMSKFCDPDRGLLVNDCCIFGVHVHEASLVKLVTDGVLERWTIEKVIKERKFTWEIKELLKQNEYLISDIFDAGNCKWQIKLCTRRVISKNYLGVFLHLNSSSALPPKTGICVDFSISILGQKLAGRNQFSLESPSFGEVVLLERKEIVPKQSYITCTLEASVTVLGVVNIS
ncbi:putative inactive serine/threonine-protein kinase fnkC isoform X1 [Canna indica]|uniref:Inactive serine/threonine-protein kinase fnkC isoform X1 n=1 Tax=Canna indica TaxID=4628 RepID=A0AAQ3QF00_9LILI|nr:putative inactive serine/threonine-protein kinase fnkC isoform X1 [Canna indica]